MFDSRTKSDEREGGPKETKGESESCGCGNEVF